MNKRSAGAVLVGLVVVWLGWPLPWRAGSVEVEGRLYDTRLADNGGPVVILLPGYHLPQHFLDETSREFYRAGFSVATVDLNRCPRPELAVKALVESFGPRPYGVFAHSGAVTYALRGCQDSSNARALVLLGFHPGGTGATAPVMLAFGKFDDYIPASEARQALEQFEAPSKSFRLSALSGHGGEPFDPRLVGAAMDWLGRSLAHPPEASYWPGWRALTLVLLGFLAGSGLGEPKWLVGVGLATGVGLPGAFGLAFLLGGILRPFRVAAWRELGSLWLSLWLALWASWWGAGRGGTLGEWGLCLLFRFGLYLPAQLSGLCQAAQQERWWKFYLVLAGLTGLGLAAHRWTGELRERGRRFAYWRWRGRWWLLLVSLLGFPGLPVFLVVWLATQHRGGGLPAAVHEGVENG